MAKKIYKIPADLDTNRLDMEISFSNKDESLASKPISVRVVLFWILSVFIGFWLMTRTFMTTFPLIGKILFLIVYLSLTFTLAKYTTRKELQLSLVKPFFSYLPKTNRRISTRTADKANDFYLLLGISAIDPDTGLIKYADGSFGFIYRVVGSASILLFDEDRDDILDRTNNFFKKFRSKAEFIIITSKESQKILKQLAALQYRYNELRDRDPDLLYLMDEQFERFKRISGEYKSIHQYLIVKAENMEELKNTHNLLKSEVLSSNRMFKQCVKLVRSEDIYSVLEPFYKMDSERIKR